MAGYANSHKETSNSIRSAAVALDPWEEISGILQSIRVVDGWVLIDLSSGKLRLRRDTREATMLLAKLTGQEGAEVSIIRTDSEVDSIRIDLQA